MTGSLHRMPKRWHALPQSSTAKARAVFIAYRDGEHTALDHQRTQCELLALIDGKGFTFEDYMLWCRRLNDVDNGAPITAVFKEGGDGKQAALGR